VSVHRLVQAVAADQMAGEWQEAATALVDANAYSHRA
jgi:hypothetical protein